MSPVIRAVGIDAAFANMGFAQVEINCWPCGFTYAPVITCLDLALVSTEITEDRKVVRKSSTELRRAQELCRALSQQTVGQGAQFAFVEVPSGSQSASAARALGIAVGVLASCQIPIIEVSPMEVKRVVNPNPKIKVSKSHITNWAIQRWPTAPWILHRSNGKTFKKGDPQNCNEHLADALATVAAGIDTPEFKRLISMVSNHAIPSAPNLRPPSGGQTRRRVQVDSL